MNRRRGIAVLALLGMLDSGYLLLAKLGYIGSLSCTVTRGCDVVNASAYSKFLGIPVAGVGLAGYVVLLAVAIAGLQPRWLDRREPDGVLAGLSGLAVAFTLYLTYAELFILHAVCQWCVISQLVIVVIFVLSLAGLRRGSSTAAAAAGRTGTSAATGIAEDTSNP
ncbi:MAG: vitamin K epoxide reductase family protein [Gemmatimonadota bacterium]|nr:MAG: vitamin K epoxide reductase family protein [Gemmatimonadota bacterium]